MQWEPCQAGGGREKYLFSLLIVILLRLGILWCFTASSIRVEVTGYVNH